MKIALVAGATGLVGSHLCRQLASADSPYDRVVALTRRPLDFSLPKLVDERADFGQLDSLDLGPVDAAFCTLGTTIKTAGSKEAFRLVDRDYVAAFARFAKRSGASSFALLTSVGADPHASNFYLQVKGEAEEAVEAVGFQSLAIFRPSFLRGDRKEVRPGERIAIPIFKAIQWALVGPLRQYRAIDAEVVAQAMAASSISPAPGIRVRFYDEIVGLAGNSYNGVAI
jgi:uncharacterized protein YbjT (DUF2867 family)